MTIVDLKARIADAAINGGSPNGNGAHDAPLRPNIRLLTVVELEAIAPPESIIDGVLFGNTLANVVAPFDAFKTFFALSMGLSIAHGAEWFGRNVTQGIVTYSIGEGLHDFGRRVRAWKEQWGADEVPNFFTCPEAFALNNPAHVDRFLNEVDKLGEKPKLCVFDTLARHLRGADSDQKDADAYLHGADTIRQETGATVLSIHHEGWNKRAGSSQSRGSSNIPSALDTEISIDRIPGDYVITVSCAKMRIAQAFAPFRLRAVPLGPSLVLEMESGLSGASLTENELKVLSCLAEVQAGATVSAQYIIDTEGVSRSGVFAALKRLRSMTYAKTDGRKHFATDAGREIARARVQNSPNQSSDNESKIVQQSQPLKGLDSGLDLSTEPSEAA
jgi:hypothetical protein